MVLIRTRGIDSRPSEQSMMPEDLWTPLDEHEVRSLVAYLASPGQVPLLATPDNVSGFFNTRDLSGWEGDPALWSVADGEIVGYAGLSVSGREAWVQNIAVRRDRPFVIGHHQGRPMAGDSGRGEI